MSSCCGFGATVIATCLVSSQTMMTSSFVLMPTSSSRVSINRQLNGNGRVGHISNEISTSAWNKPTPIKLNGVRPSGRSDTFTKNERNISQMTLPQILQLLNRLNIRYPPDAARSELEELIHQYYKSNQQPETASQSKSTSPSSSTSPLQSRPNIVDAVVLDDDTSVNDKEYHPRDQTERESVRRRQYRQSFNRQGRQGRTTSRPNNRSSDSDTYRAEHRTKSNQYRPRRRRENYDLYNTYNPTVSNRARRRNGDAIDLDTFDLPDEMNNQNEYYDNGAQIFLMGFLEAGKTAAQLALGSVAEAVNPFSGEKRWYDEERGREVLDVNILDYSPDYGQRTQRRYSGETGRVRRRRRPVRSKRSYHDFDSEASDIPPRRRRRRDIERQPTSNVARNPMRNSLEQSVSFPVATENGSSTVGSADNSTAQLIENEKRNQPRNERSRHDGAKPIYGLYSADIDSQTQPDIPYNATEQRQEQQLHSKKDTHPKKIWKKRLRKKFDAALGLQSPTSPSSTESLYDSWKTQVGGVHDGRKEALRNQMNKQKSPTTGPSRNNRRSRMRAKLNSNHVGRTAQSYLDEPPFWRKDGTIASVLFDSQQSAPVSRRERDAQLKRRYNNSLDTLEALLRSPLGRQNTVTSLVIFIARSSLSWFGTLCRWAGVRGTIPQPIVVTSVFAMGISSRRGYKTLSLCLSLLALRMVGEFLHGSLHGNEFWEDEYNKDKHEWTQE